MTTAVQQIIPSRGHYVWYGTSFPYMNAVAIKTALARSKLDELWIWCSDSLRGQPYFDELCRNPRIKPRDLSLASLLADAPAVLPFDVPRLSEIYTTVRSHVSRSNIARALIAYVYGGVYFDIDTLCCNSFEPLLDRQAFVGTEHVIWPYERRRRVDAYRLVWGPLLGQLRKLTVQLPVGDELYRRTQHLYATAANAAILGGRAQHPVFSLLLELTSEVPKERWQVPHALGTHVVQRAVSAYSGGDLSLLGPQSFFPLGPVVSRWYFRKQRDVEAAVSRVVSPETLAIHWYASVSDLSKLTPADVVALSRNTIFGHLCRQITESEAPTPFPAFGVQASLATR